MRTGTPLVNKKYFGQNNTIKLNNQMKWTFVRFFRKQNTTKITANNYLTFSLEKRQYKRIYVCLKLICDANLVEH